MKITMYTDGSSKGNPGPGGWGCILLTEHKTQNNKQKIEGDVEDFDEVIELGGSETITTNNRMELLGAIMGLREIGPTMGITEVEVCTDSQYVKKGMSEWINGWIAKNWIGSTKKPVLNRDLWELLKKEEERLNKLAVSITWTYVRGHAGIPLNERADVIATSCADSVSTDGATNLQLYRGRKEEYTHL
jgi:ribonuclease HI